MAYEYPALVTSETAGDLERTPKVQLHIHLGAGIDRVQFNGTTYDRRTMDREAKYQLRRAVVTAFERETQPKPKGRRRHKRHAA